MHAGPRLLPRRTALALGVTALAVAGCDDGDSPEPSTTPTPDPDVALVEAMLAKLNRAWQLATAASLADLASLHEAHIEALDGTTPTPYPGPAPAKAVRRNEIRLHSALVDAAMAAQSGALARLLASMSAAVSQRLA